MTVARTSSTRLLPPFPSSHTLIYLSTLRSPHAVVAMPRYCSLRRLIFTLSSACFFTLRVLVVLVFQHPSLCTLFTVLILPFHRPYSSLYSTPFLASLSSSFPPSRFSRVQLGNPEDVAACAWLLVGANGEPAIRRPAKPRRKTTDGESSRQLRGPTRGPGKGQAG